ncbi:MAG: tRNA pseudouridine(54/55) synthase Pus10 [Candidatus Bipolaricaulia bacterium]
MGDLVETANRILEKYRLCDPCLGRQFGWLSTGLTNAARGRALRIAVALDRDGPISTLPTTPCWLCEGRFTELDRWAQRAVSAVAGIEFKTYLVGTQVPESISEREQVLIHEFGIDSHEPFQREFNREVGKRLSQLLEDRQDRTVTVDFDRPEVVLLLELDSNHIKVQINPLFLYGRYTKQVRGIPQTHWPCRTCRGRGCEACDYTGKRYPESVEELIAEPIVAATQGSKAMLHGAGREDIDARMLGDGRPFVLEVKEPRVRCLDLKTLEAEINARAQGKIQVRDLRTVGGEAVERVKSLKADKIYRIRVLFEQPVTEAQLNGALGELIGEIRQRTPTRVSHRRADKVRIRQVIEAYGELTGDREAEIEIRGESGLYIKELISGDEGRTNPSLAGLLGVDAQVETLDVLAVLADLDDLS